MLNCRSLEFNPHDTLYLEEYHEQEVLYLR